MLVQELCEAQTALHQQAERLTTTEAKLTATHTQLSSAQSALSDAEAQLSAAQDSIAELQRQFSDEKAERKSERSAWKAERAQLVSDRDGYRSQVCWACNAFAFYRCPSGCVLIHAFLPTATQLFQLEMPR